MGASLGTFVQMDEIDRSIVALLQYDASQSVREIAEQVGLSPTPCWRRIARLEDMGVIVGRVAMLDPAKVGLGVTVLVQIRTNQHTGAWFEDFAAGIDEFPEIVEALRLSGETDYMLRVMVPDIAAFDVFYQRLIERVDLYDVRSTFVMETIKSTTALPLGHLED